MGTHGSRLGVIFRVQESRLREMSVRIIKGKTQYGKKIIMVII